MANYIQREELKSDPVVEPTAVTIKSIKEILAEEGQEHLLQETSEPAPRPEPEPELQPAPTARAQTPAQPHRMIQQPPHHHDLPSLSSDPAPEPRSAPKPAQGGFLSRFFGGR